MRKKWYHKLARQLALFSVNLGLKVKHIVLVQVFLFLFVIAECFNISYSYSTYSLQPLLIITVFALIICQITVIVLLHFFKSYLTAIKNTDVEFSPGNGKSIKAKIGRFIKIAVACYAVYVGLAIIIGGIDTILLIESGAESRVDYIGTYLLFGYPIIAVILWPIFSRKLE